MPNPPLKIGVSACLLGAKVRFDGGHKISRFITDELARYAEFVSVCPEMGMGLPVPRPTLRLISENQRIRLVETKDGVRDHTEALENYAQHKIAELSDSKLCGYIVCAKSPSCGMERVKVYKNNGSEKEGVGIYTRILLEKMPWLPVEEDGRLHDPVLCENFITRIYCLHDFYTHLGDAASAKKVVDFHSRYKLMLMAHHPQSYQMLGQLVAQVKQYSLETFIQQYRLGLMQALTQRASRKNNTNVLMHLQGYFKRVLNPLQKAELSQVIESYRIGELPLLAPLTLLKHYLVLYPDAYLAQQRYLNPYPAELKLRYGL
ncbi:DUF523 and DUF1722 domain-containing protein (plasmid) [Vibrio sp. HDW18]|uniref:YbgA family protein n=1 Tax=Vibrio sp. HDW18 TaxID=2714948 RepID=UPI00140A3D74|nr:DUF523 and DUF1722 domain-containing protein [Vibrio sp. HDW18]QIL86727.1 DUF523 and DUF1722 domain-containing protein [Vibrio sp. HDW18]